MTTGTSLYTAEELQALTDAAFAVTSERSLDRVLQKLVDVGRTLVHGRYGALSVLRDDGGIDRFLTSGISDEERRRIGHIPEGHGLLGVLLHEGKSLRVADVSKDPRSVGFPPHHPPMTSLLGVPVIARGRIIGNLYIADKAGADEFDERDEEMIRLLSAQAAAAIENAQLYDKLGSLARLEERERIAMDLHDGVIQTVYAVALHLEDLAGRLPSSAQPIRPELEKAMDDLDHVIKEIRSYIFDLRPKVSQITDLPGALDQLIEGVRVNTLMRTDFEISEPLNGPAGEAEALALFHIAQEALNNVVKHSRATAVGVKLQSSDGRLRLEIRDNGVGFSEEVGEGKHGLRNMMDRARSVGAWFNCESKPGSGTTIRVELNRGQELDDA